MKIEQININDLVVPEKNVRVHTEKQVAELKKSVDMFGQIRPVVIDENNVILAGNGLVEAMKLRGDKQVNVLRLTDLTENQKKKLMLVDNRIYTLGFDNNEVIFELLEELKGDYDIPGYEEEMLRELLEDEEEKINELIEDYGKLTPEETQPFKEAGQIMQEKIATQQERIQESDSEQIQEQGAEPILSGRPAVTMENKPETLSETSPVEAAESLEERPKVNVQQNITCPHCGETIWL